MEGIGLTGTDPAFFDAVDLIMGKALPGAGVLEALGEPSIRGSSNPSPARFMEKLSSRWRELNRDSLNLESFVAPGSALCRIGGHRACVGGSAFGR